MNEKSYLIIKIDNDIRLYKKTYQKVSNLEILYRYLKPSDISLAGGMYQELNDLKDFAVNNELNLKLSIFNRVKNSHDYFDRNLTDRTIKREEVIALHVMTLQDVDSLIKELEVLKISLGDKIS